APRRSAVSGDSVTVDVRLDAPVELGAVVGVGIDWAQQVGRDPVLRELRARGERGVPGLHGAADEVGQEIRVAERDTEALGARHRASFLREAGVAVHARGYPPSRRVGRRGAGAPSPPPLPAGGVLLVAVAGEV